jgi:molybdopterin converting factor small subunit
MGAVKSTMEKEDQGKITVQLFGYLREAAGKKRLKVNSRGTLLETLAETRKEYPSLDAKMDTAAYVILLNDVNLLGKDLSQVILKEGDIITFVPFVAGG